MGFAQRGSRLPWAKRISCDGFMNQDLLWEGVISIRRRYRRRVHASRWKTGGARRILLPETNRYICE
jgi:hypothetical protein